ncbi:MAG: peptidylprolyl isomerase, partial [Desulfobacterales bacterium]|nr:peptidylprolyl isomerase [Desulfobacterales bacterium]
PRAITIVTALYVIIVVCIIGIPYYHTCISPWQQPVLQVRDKVFTLNFFTEELRHKTKSSEEDIQTAAVSLLQELQSGELIREEALRRDISISKIEVEQTSATRIKRYHNSTDSSASLMQTMLKELGLNEESFYQQVRSELTKEKLLKDFIRQLPNSAPHIHIQAILLESPGKAEAIREMVIKGENFNTLASKMSIDIQSAKKNGDLGWWPRGVWQKPTIGMIRGEGILCQTREEANLIREKIRAGNDLAKLARQYSRDETSRVNNGYLGWVPIDYKSGKQFASESYNLKPGRLSVPINTREGFWIIRLLEKSPGGNAFDDFVFHQPAGWVSPPLYTDNGCYLIRIAGREKNRLLSEAHQRILACRSMDLYLLNLAKKGSEEGWIKWHWGSDTMRLVMGKLSR